MSRWFSSGLRCLGNLLNLRNARKRRVHFSPSTLEFQRKRNCRLGHSVIPFENYFNACRYAQADDDELFDYEGYVSLRDIWQHMSKAQKQPYVDEAKAARQRLVRQRQRGLATKRRLEARTRGRTGVSLDMPSGSVERMSESEEDEPQGCRKARKFMI